MTCPLADARGSAPDGAQDSFFGGRSQADFRQGGAWPRWPDASPSRCGGVEKSKREPPRAFSGPRVCQAQRGAVGTLCWHTLPRCQSPWLIVSNARLVACIRMGHRPGCERPTRVAGAAMTPEANGQLQEPNRATPEKNLQRCRPPESYPVQTLASMADAVRSAATGAALDAMFLL